MLDREVVVHSFWYPMNGNKENNEMQCIENITDKFIHTFFYFLVIWFLQAIQSNKFSVHIYSGYLQEPVSLRRKEG